MKLAKTSQIVSGFLFATLSLSISTPAQETQNHAPVVAKVEPPNWWINLTPDVMLLLSGHDLQATQLTCNLPEVIVSRTQASHGGDYLFVWLKFSSNARTGTLVCRMITPTGNTSFELPLAAREPTAQRFHGLAQDDVIYLIMPDRFANGDPTNDAPAEFPNSHDRAKPRAWHGGDLRGIRDHLPYLQDLGVNTLWLTPIVKNGATEDYHGYGAADLYSVDPHFGSLDDYKELVTAAHKRQMKILFDSVPNHVGPHHPWVIKPPLRDWFHGTSQRHLDSYSPLKKSFYGQPEKSSVANDPFEALVDPHAAEDIRRNLTDGWFFGVLPDLNTENPIVAQYLLQNAIWWIESSGLDGLREDTFPYIPRKFWSDWHASLHRVYPQLSFIGEVFHPDPGVTSFFVGGRRGWDGLDTGLTTVFDFPLQFAIRDVLLNNAPAGRIANILRQDSLYPHPEFLVSFFANHDIPRFASAEGSSPEKLKLAFGLILTLRGIPELYYGDELGMTGGADPENRHDFPGGWIEDQKNAFTEEGRSSKQQEIFSTVQNLLRLRREHPALTTGRLWHLFSDDSSYVFLRQTQDERILVVFNNSKDARSLAVPVLDTPAAGISNLSPLYGRANAQLSTAGVSINTPPQSLSIFLLE
ncbi:MAG: cyclomaltodextrinase N-terminal domain-containing protein [Acidobacteria bacterium]|nr:cyclomaltodextrinase N-terminal domain-containing protein [Acidobacteriota bacterium]MBS1867022.1 cyclomaltodextrinase N-terminal domain-containing protein [Acidobacteriota bacterium]